jgi:5-methylcytosine-specific restriction protein B
LYRTTGFLENESFKDREYDFSQIKLSELNSQQKEAINVSSDELGSLTIAEWIEPAFFIVDEINRAELSRVFGELMICLEYRGYSGKIKTQYSHLNEKDSDSVYYWENNQDWFFIPQNLYLIGTMNNIDRSVDSFDFALRRRFMWEEVHPNYWVIKRELSQKWKGDLASSLERLNNAIENTEFLGKDYRIGHSYALYIKPIQFKYDNVTDVKELLWQDFIKPLIQEYLRGLGNEQKAKEALSGFRKSFFEK